MRFPKMWHLSSVETVQPPLWLRNSKCFSVSSLTLIEYSSMIRLRVCAGWSEALLVAHTTLLEISCRGSFHWVNLFLERTTVCKRWKSRAFISCILNVFTKFIYPINMRWIIWAITWEMDYLLYAWKLLHFPLVLKNKLNETESAVSNCMYVCMYVFFFVFFWGVGGDFGGIRFYQNLIMRTGLHIDILPLCEYKPQLLWIHMYHRNAVDT